MTMDVVKFSETWAISREQESHKEALMTFGEKAIIRRVWKLDDYIAGSVTRCVVCQAGTTSSQRSRIASVYQQAGESYCSSCYGTGFTGGFEPTIYISYVLISDEGREWKHEETGTMEVSRMMVQFPWTPLLDPGDLLVRIRTWSGDTPVQELDRYVLGSTDQVTVRTGPARRTSPTMTTLHDPLTLVAQKAEVRNLSQDHPYRGVPIS